MPTKTTSLWLSEEVSEIVSGDNWCKHVCVITLVERPCMRLLLFILIKEEHVILKVECTRLIEQTYLIQAMSLQLLLAPCGFLCILYSLHLRLLPGS